MAITRNDATLRAYRPAKEFAGAAREWLLRTDPERLICLGRVITAVFAILAIYLDPTRPNSMLYESRLVLGLYLLLAVALVFFPLRFSFVSPVHLLIHGVDAAVVGWLTFLTNELASPFFSILPFVILAMTMRWGLKGASLGALIALIVQLVVGLPDLLDGDAELNIFIMRSIYFVLIAATLGYFGAYRERSRQRLAQLAQWPSGAIGEDRLSWLSIVMQHASGVLGDAHLLVIWREQEFESGCAAFWTSGRLQLADLRDPEFWRRHDPDGCDERHSRSGEALNGLFADLPQIHANAGRPNCKVVSAAFSSLRYRGRVFVISYANSTDDMKDLTQIIATRVGTELERVALIQAARAEGRMRLARDLHDSVLQNLTAARLKLKLIGEAFPDGARQKLMEVGSLILEQQQCVRKFVDENRPGEEGNLARLDQDLPEFLDLLRMQWSCSIDVSIGSPGMMVPRWMLFEIMQLISEAVANAVRHGRATVVRIGFIGSAGLLELDISDNGTGIADGLTSKKPFSLSQRIAELGGSLAICRSSPGIGLTITLPLKPGLR
ncbi:sensor histidine kinase [Sinorhizobium medicae]|nr:sensor histidine kinase [Sinorhizobium medicae]MDX1147356.1 sensor histidine kinase [Sinorhizobium medicae]